MRRRLGRSRARTGRPGQLARRLLDRALQAEITDHLGYPPGQAPPGGAGNARNGQPAKTVDAQTRAELEDLILQARDRYGMTVALVTHDIDEAVYIGDGTEKRAPLPTLDATSRSDRPSSLRRRRG